jgi:hypothetical protein
MGNGGGGGGHANSNLHKRDRVGADCNWTTHFLIGLTVLVRLMVKGLPELNTSKKPPNTFPGSFVGEQFELASHTEYLKLFVPVTWMVDTSEFGATNGLVLTMLSLKSNRTFVQPNM